MAENKERKSWSISSRRRESASRQPVRPFVCSTFQDFRLERDFLSNDIFPRLQELCKSRGTSFEHVDLRWKGNQPQTNSSCVLQLCLNFIEKCSPFFICLLGERYGVYLPPDGSAEYDSNPERMQWMSSNLENAVACGHNWVLEDEYRNCSLTELEIVQASFRKKYDYGYFYFRDPGHLDDKLAGVSAEEDRQHMSSVYRSESSYAEKKLRELKQQIIDTELPVKYFRTLEELGFDVTQDWMAVIDALFPPLESFIFDVNSEQFEEWRDHEMYAFDCKQGLVKTPDVTKIQSVMNQHGQAFQPMERRPTLAFPSDMEMSQTFLTSIPSFDGESSPSVLVITGDRGSGKTAIISTWVERFSSVFPESTLISHYVGCNLASCDVMQLMQRCTTELRDRYRGTHADQLYDLEDLTNYGRIKEAFRASLALGPSVIVIDGINQLSGNVKISTHVAKELDWLPSVLPDFCRVIITTTTSDLTFRSLSSRNDVCCLHIAGLEDTKSKTEILLEHLGESAHLHFDVNKIVMAELGHLPLFYVILAREMHALASSKNAEKQIDQYIHAASLSELWGAIIRRWTHDYSWLVPTSSRGPVQVVKTQVSKDKMNNGWVADTLRLLATSKQGLLEEEILGLLTSAGYVESFQVSSAPLALLLAAALGPLRHAPSGLLTFSNQCFKEAVCSTLLGNLTLQVTPVSVFNNAWEKQKRLCHMVLVSYFDSLPFSPRVIDELPWQLRLLGDTVKLHSILMQPEMFVPFVWYENYPSKKSELINYWNEMEKKGFRIGESCQEMFAISKGNEGSGLSSTLGLDVSVAESICRKDSTTAMYSPLELSCLAFCAGRLLLELKDYASAESLLVKAFQHGHTTVSVKELPLLCDIERCLGDLYSQIHLSDQARYWYNAALKTAEEANNGPAQDEVSLDATVAHVLDMLAMAEMEHIRHEKPSSACTRPGSRPPQSSLQLVPKSDRTSVETPEGMLSQALKQMQLAQLRPGEARVEYHFGLLKVKEGRFLEAHTYFHRALQSLQTWYGPNHPSVADVLDDLAGILCHPANSDLYDKTQAEDLYRRALAVREVTLNKLDIKVAETLYHLGKLLQVKGTKDASREAKDLLQRALDIHTVQLGVYHLKTKGIRLDLKRLDGEDLTTFSTTPNAKPKRLSTKSERLDHPVFK